MITIPALLIHAPMEYANTHLRTVMIMIHALLTLVTRTEIVNIHQWFAMITTNVLMISVRVDNVNSHLWFAMIMILALLIPVVMTPDDASTNKRIVMTTIHALLIHANMENVKTNL